MMSDRILSHRDLKVWQKSVELVDRVYDLSTTWPREERYGLTSQVRRASVSVPSNIAEGNGRTTTRDYLRFIDHSYGSLMEVDTQMHVARNRGYIRDSEELELINQVTEIAKMLNGLVASLRKRMQQTGHTGRRTNSNP